MKPNRRTLISSASTAVLLLSMGAAWAAQPVVEIIASPRHVQPLSPLRLVG